MAATALENRTERSPNPNLPAPEAGHGRTVRELIPVWHRRILHATTYQGIPTLKWPLDFWVYQELVWRTRPDVIVEIGNAHGGSLLALAHLCDSIGHGRLIGVDVTHARLDPRVRQHPRITLLEGDAGRMFTQVRDAIGPHERTMVLEDSSHTYANTLAVLRTYSSLVRPGDYLIVEDGIGRHGLECGPSPGPFEAVRDFLSECDDFEVDGACESFQVTWNPSGYLRRKGGVPQTPPAARKPRRGLRHRLQEFRRWWLPPIVSAWFER